MKPLIVKVINNTNQGFVDSKKPKDKNNEILKNNPTTTPLLQYRSIILKIIQFSSPNA